VFDSDPRLRIAACGIFGDDRVNGFMLTVAAPSLEMRRRVETLRLETLAPGIPRTPDGMCYYYEQVGFAKINGKWSLAIRTVDGDVRDDDDIESWPFNEAPRGLRVKAVYKLPISLSNCQRRGESRRFLGGRLGSVLESEAENTTDKPPARLPLRPVRERKGMPRTETPAASTPLTASKFRKSLFGSPRFPPMDRATISKLSTPSNHWRCRF
jgi:hypothetical protein